MADKHIHETGTKARAGATPGVMRYVLAISLALVIVLFGVVLYHYA